MTHDNRLAAFVHTLRFEAQGILGVELRPQDQVFPPFSAGAHIDLHLPNGLVRSYSLLNSPEDCGRYVLGILRDRGSRGGSAFVHDSLRVGMQLQISRPRNLFPLEENAAHSVLVAGGIGVTPIYCMFNRLRALGRSVELLYCARSRQEAAFVEELAASDAAIQLHFDDEKGGPMDLGAFLGARASTAHFYCCGPTPMIDAFETHCERLGHPHVHIERFAAAPRPRRRPRAATKCAWRAAARASRCRAASRCSTPCWKQAWRSIAVAARAFAVPARPVCWKASRSIATAS